MNMAVLKDIVYPVIAVTVTLVMIMMFIGMIHAEMLKKRKTNADQTSVMIGILIIVRVVMYIIPELVIIRVVQ